MIFVAIVTLNTQTALLFLRLHDLWHGAAHHTFVALVTITSGQGNASDFHCHGYSHLINSYSLVRLRRILWSGSYLVLVVTVRVLLPWLRQPTVKSWLALGEDHRLKLKDVCCRGNNHWDILNFTERSWITSIGLVPQFIASPETLPVVLLGVFLSH